jgi:ZIP family zinc transporter
LIPESQRNEANIDLVTLATMVGFAIVMILDVALG